MYVVVAAKLCAVSPKTKADTDSKQVCIPLNSRSAFLSESCLQWLGIEAEQDFPRHANADAKMLNGKSLEGCPWLPILKRACLYWSPYVTALPATSAEALQNSESFRDYFGEEDGIYIIQFMSQRKDIHLPAVVVLGQPITVDAMLDCLLRALRHVHELLG